MRALWLESLYRTIQSYSGKGAQNAMGLGGILQHCGLPGSFGVNGKLKDPIRLEEDKRLKGGINVEVSSNILKDVGKLYDQKIPEDEREKLLDQIVQKIEKIKSDFEKK